MIKTRGFTLIEVLISMVIMAIGLLGLAALQGISLRDNQDAYYYQQATLLAYEMQDRIRGNSAEWATNGVPSTIATTASCTCTATPCTGCTSGKMAQTDYKYWADSAARVFPAPTTGEMVKITSTAQANTPCSTVAAGISLCLITRWARTHSQSSDTSSKLSDTATFYLKVTP